MAGHSLGELAALVAAGALDERDGLELVALRGRLMHESGERAGDGGMLALLGAAPPSTRPSSPTAHGLAVANDNSPQQVVLSGERDALRRRRRRPPRSWGCGAIELAVTGAFHSPMMARGGARVRARRLSAVEIAAPRVPVFSAVTAAPFDDVRARAGRGADQPGALARDDAGAARARRSSGSSRSAPARVLTGLVKRTLEDVELVHA